MSKQEACEIILQESLVYNRRWVCNVVYCSATELWR